MPKTHKLAGELFADVTFNTSGKNSVDVKSIRDLKNILRNIGIIGTEETWNQLGSDIDGEAVFDQSGYSISLSADGTIVVIGAPGNDGNGNGSGHVRIYKWNGVTWGQLGPDIDGVANNNFSGSSVSLSANGTIVAIGAPYNDDAGTDSGHVQIYKWDGTTWGQLGSDIDGEAASDQSGRSVSLSADGSIVAIGAPGNNGNGNGSGHVRIYKWDGTTWGQLGSDIDGEAAGDLSGRSVSLSADGSIVAIGAPGNNGNGNGSGHVRIYKWNGVTWGQLGTDIDGEAVFEESGYSVSLSADGTIVVIGAPFNGKGVVRIYKWNGTAWDKLGSDIDGEVNGGEFGTSVSLSSDGTIVAIGAPYKAIGGVVRIYEWNGTAWDKLGSDIPGEAAGDGSGSSVSLSADGTIVAIGGPYNDDAGNTIGHVRVFRLL